jgi:carboxyl-terminal processing protease
MLFTADDPSAPIPAGYTLVNLDEEPFRFYKEPHPRLTLYEGDAAVNDFSDLSYAEAFEALFQKVSREYPFSAEKEIDWQALHSEYADRMALVGNDEQFYRALKDFTMEFPDEHVGISFNDVAGKLFFEEYGGSFGMILTELSDSRVLATAVLPGLPAADAGVRVGAEILAWGGLPIGEAIAAVEPFFGPYSTAHSLRLGQLVFLTRLPPGESVAVTFKNPGEAQPTTVEMQAEAEYDSLIQAIPSFLADELALPIEACIVDGLGYIKINTFSDDFNLMAQLWDRYMKQLIELEVAGLILDLRVNGGGNSGLARDFAGYFYEEETVLMKRSYYNERTGQFEYQQYLARVLPAPVLYEGPVAVLVSPYCVSACEGFTYSLSLLDNVTIVGHAPSAGAYGEVGRGQYDLPSDLSMQFPTGRTESPEGELLIEGVGIVPDLLVPISAQSALGQLDAVLEAAIAALTD